MEWISKLTSDNPERRPTCKELLGAQNSWAIIGNEKEIFQIIFNKKDEKYSGFKHENSFIHHFMTKFKNSIKVEDGKNDDPKVIQNLTQIELPGIMEKILNRDCFRKNLPEFCLKVDLSEQLLNDLNSTFKYDMKPVMVCDKT